MASFAEFVRFCATRAGCDKGGLYAIQPRGLRGSPIKIGYSFNLLRRLADWEYSYPSGIDVLAVARMNRPNDTHFHKRRALQLAEALLKQELRQFIVAREEWLTPRAKAETLAAPPPAVAEPQSCRALLRGGADQGRAALCAGGATPRACTPAPRATSARTLALPSQAQKRGAKMRG